MYVPDAFRETDREAVLDFIEEYGFATLISPAPEGPFVSHVPLLIDRGAAGSDPGGERLLGHVARANRHWTHFDGEREALAIFHGPHGYISPSWYATHPSVPTWSYAVVHVRGVPRVVDSGVAWGVLTRLVEKHERGRPDAWTPDLPQAFIDEDLSAIVGFEIPVASIEAKLKLGQNRDEADRQGVLAGLERQGDRGSLDLAALIRRTLERKGRGPR